MAEESISNTPSLGHLLAPMLVWLGVIAGFHFSTTILIGVDDYYHLRIAELMRDDGIFFREFPYATESVWVTSYFDKEWLFHVLLVPFSWLGKINSAKAAVILGNAAIVWSLWRLFLALNVARPGWWLMAIPFAVFEYYWGRLLLCRPHLLSLVILFFALRYMVNRQPIRLFCASVIYALSYTGHWQLIGLLAVYDLLYAVIDEHGRRRAVIKQSMPMIVYGLIGIAMGEVLHPHFPNNVKGLYIQNVLVLKTYWSGSAADIVMAKPAELNPIGAIRFIFNFAPILLLMAIIAVHVLFGRRRLTRDGYLFAAYSLIYCVLTLKSGRFLEYLSPVTMLFGAVVNDRTPIFRWLQSLGSRIVIVTVLGVYIVLGTGKCFMNNVVIKSEQQQHQLLYAGAAEWLTQNLSPGEIVFTAGWDDAPPLFYQAPGFRFLVFLDPYFMYVRSPDRFSLLHQIGLGAATNPVEKVMTVFDSRVIFARAGFQSLIRQLEHHPQAANVYTGPMGEKLFLLKRQ